MALQTSHKWIIIILAILFLGVIGYFIYKAIPKSAPPAGPPSSTTTTTPGLADTALSIYCKAFPNSKLCGGKGKGVNCVDGCDQNKYGYDCNGFLDPANCGAGRVMQ